MNSANEHVPPGWPAVVPPPAEPGWQGYALDWLLDHCPADYRGYEAWRRHPVALAWIAARHINGQVEVMRESYRRARVELGEHLDAEALAQVLEALAAEGLRLRAAALSARLLSEALAGAHWVPRL